MCGLSPDNVRFLLFFVVGPMATYALYAIGAAMGSRLLMLPGRICYWAMGALVWMFRIIAPLAYIPLLLFAVAAVAVVPGLWAVVLALGLGRWILKS